MTKIETALLNDPAIDVFWNLVDEDGRRAQVRTPADIPDDMILIGFEVRLWEMASQAELFGPPRRVRLLETRELALRP